MPDVELRKEGDTATISGDASIFNTAYPIGHFTERVAPGAFTATLSSNPDVVLCPQHDRSRAIARTPRTLTLTQTSTGLHYVGTVDLNDSDARSVVSKIENGIFGESSFSFRVPKGGDSWNEDYTQRTILAADIHRGDVAVVPYGASPTTTAAVTRAAVGTLEERRAMAAKVSSTGWFGPGLVLRQGGTTCPDCGGSGECPTCDGTGRINGDAHPEADFTQYAEPRRRGGPSGPQPLGHRPSGPPVRRRRARLAANDSAELRALLSRPDGPRRPTEQDWAQRERPFLAECQAARERGWAAHPELRARRALLEDYERLIGQ